MAVSDLKKEQILDEDAVNALKKRMEKGISVELNQIDVIYKEGNQGVSKGDFRADTGEIVAIIGPSGNGKTTLIRVLLGLLYPAEGTARLVSDDGTSCPISSATREFFGYVPQGNTVVAGTIAENMRMVKADATDEEIIRA